jgi:hypothetical protein
LFLTKGVIMAKGIEGSKIKAKRIADVQTVLNTCKRPAAAAKYNHFRIQLEDGKEYHVMLTDNELMKGLERAKKNPEDCPDVSLIRDILD